MSWKCPPSFTPPAAPEADELDRVLGARLAAVAHAVGRCTTVVDVGTDHGRLPIALLKAGRVQQALAVDVNEAPLAGAQARAQRAGVDGAMAFLLGDGLLPLGERRAEVATLAGVGGALVGRVLRVQQPQRYGIGRVVAQPMSEERVLRAMVSESDWTLVDERLVVEGGRLFYVAMLEPGQSPRYTVEDIVLGPVLRHATDAVWVAWLEVQRRWLRARVRARAATPESAPTPGLPPAGVPWPVDGTEPELDPALHLQFVEDALARLTRHAADPCVV